MSSFWRVVVGLKQRRNKGDTHDPGAPQVTRLSDYLPDRRKLQPNPPRPAKPAINIGRLDGSGTGTVPIGTVAAIDVAGSSRTVTASTVKAVIPEFSFVIDSFLRSA
jgi:hypothetical protein